VTQDEFYAGLGYTVIFGLVFSSVITLVAVPVLYYSVFRDKEHGEISHRQKFKDLIIYKTSVLKQSLSDRFGKNSE
jgi:Cu/Ag efflux pump CusA